MDSKTIETAVRVAQALSPDPDTREGDPGGDLLAKSVLGEQVLIRTVTMIYTGHVESIDSSTIELSSAAWIADTGRFADALESGTLSEVEPYPASVFVARASIVDVTFWEHLLPTTQK